MPIIFVNYLSIKMNFHRKQEKKDSQQVYLVSPQETTKISRMEELLWRALVQRHQETIKILQVGSSSVPLRNQQNRTHGGAIVAGSSSVKPRNQQDLTKEGSLMAGSSSVPPQRVLQDSIASHNASLAPIQEGSQPIPGKFFPQHSTIMCPCPWGLILCY